MELGKKGENPFETELLRLEEDYNRNWLKYEGANLRGFVGRWAEWNRTGVPRG